MRENLTYGSVRGAIRKDRSYRDESPGPIPAFPARGEGCMVRR